MPKCTINGKSVEVKPGTTIIQAFKEAQIEIAHYCWHPGLSIAGVCRLCMVQIEGQPRLQIACNTVVQEGMVINNNSDAVKDAVKWGLDFHLINHPLDCPICDQAGECELQNQYMKFGQYDPEMAEPKQKKRKVVDLGPKVVLDTERCILCSRCVRFCSEVTKTNELGIFNRGDRSEIGTYKDKPLDNNYSVNTIDICPVGALTSKDFRFRQRVWYMQEAETICTGCSTGCSVKVHYNEEGAWRVKPKENGQVNGHWMCDKGRDVYKFVNRPARLTQAKAGSKDQWQILDPMEAALNVGQKLREFVKKDGADKVALVVTGQYTNEEYDALLDWAVRDMGIKGVYHWMNNPEDMNGFDGILFRGDRNPNTKGLQARLEKLNLKNEWKALESGVKSGAYQWVIVAGPENNSVFPDLAQKVDGFSSARSLVWLTAGKSDALDASTTVTTQIPLKTYLEKNGTYTNHAGVEQKVKIGTTIVPQSLTLDEVVKCFRGEALDLEKRPQPNAHLKQNYLVEKRGQI